MKQLFYLKVNILFKFNLEVRGDFFVKYIKKVPNIYFA